MNSMSNSIENLVKDVSQKFNVLNVDNVTSSQVSFDLDKNEVHSALSYIKSVGWRQLSLLTCIDWIEENEFQLVL